MKPSLLFYLSRYLLVHGSQQSATMRISFKWTFELKCKLRKQILFHWEAQRMFHVKQKYILVGHKRSNDAKIAHIPFNKRHYNNIPFIIVILA